MVLTYLGNILLTPSTLKLGSQGVEIFLGQEDELPSGYTRLDYIQSTGTQRIDTGITGNAHWNITAQSTVTTSGTQVLLTSTTNALAGTWFGIYGLNWALGSAATTNINLTTKITADLIFDTTGVSGTVNGQYVERKPATTVTHNEYTLFKTKSSDKFTGKLFEAVVYQNDLLVSKLIPARLESTGELGLYDTVRNIFLTNVGTGKFIEGNVVLPKGYTTLNYIQSNGTQWIDTGINGLAVTGFEVKAYAEANGTSNAQVLGGTSEAATSFFGIRVIGTAKNWYAMNSTGNSLVPATATALTKATIVPGVSQTGTITNINTGVTSNFAKLASTASSWSFPNENLLLFGGVVARRAPLGRCYMLKLRTEEGLVRNYVPAKRNSDNKVGMYDLITKEFVSSATSTDFIGSNA